MFVARNTKKKQFKCSKQLDPPKAKDRENLLKKRVYGASLLAAYCGPSVTLNSHSPADATNARAGARNLSGGCQRTGRCRNPLICMRTGECD